MIRIDKINYYGYDVIQHDDIGKSIKCNKITKLFDFKNEPIGILLSQVIQKTNYGYQFRTSEFKHYMDYVYIKGHFDKILLEFDERVISNGIETGETTIINGDIYKEIGFLKYKYGNYVLPVNPYSSYYISIYTNEHIDVYINYLTLNEKYNKTIWNCIYETMIQNTDLERQCKDICYEVVCFGIRNGKTEYYINRIYNGLMCYINVTNNQEIVNKFLTNNNNEIKNNLKNLVIEL